jgi:outer membrane protein assembly factor BamB
MHYYDSKPVSVKKKIEFSIPDRIGDGPIDVEGKYFIYSHWSKNGTKTASGPALFSESGKMIWEIILPVKEKYNSIRSIPVYANGLIFCTNRGGIIALNAETGQIVWERHLPEIFLYTSVKIYGDKIILNTKSDIYLLSIENGKTLKKIQVKTFGDLFIDKEFLFFREKDKVGRINLLNFSEKTIFNASPLDSCDIRTCIFVDEKCIFFGTNNLLGSPTIGCINKQTLTLKWVSMTEAGLMILAASSNYLISTDGKSNIYCVDRENGMVQWSWCSYDNLSNSISYAVIVQDTVHITYRDNMGEQLKAFQLDSGKVRWTLENVRWTSYPLPTENGVLVQHNFDKGNRLIKYVEQTDVNTPN